MGGLEIELLVIILVGWIGVNIRCICCKCRPFARLGRGCCFVVWPFARLGRRCVLMKFTFQKKNLI